MLKARAKRLARDTVRRAVNGVVDYVKDRVSRTPSREFDHTNVYCGYDITANLERGLEYLEDKYAMLTRAQKERLSYALVNPPEAAVAWDIVTLVGDNPSKILADDKWGNGDGNRTVTFRERCYLATAVNYVLWGRIHRLLHDDGIKPGGDENKSKVYAASRYSSNPGHYREMFYDNVSQKDWTLAFVKEYRGYKNIVDWDGVSAAVKWAEAGWTRDWAKIEGSELKNSDSVTYHPCPTKCSTGLLFRLLPNLTDPQDRANAEYDGLIMFNDQNEFMERSRKK